jgi:hypothetical protein
MNYTITNLTDPSRNETPQEGDFLRYSYDDGSIREKHYYPLVTQSQDIIDEQEGKSWRNRELQSTDFIVPLTDYPNHADWLTYRQALRDWPSTDNFPDTKPIGSDAISGSLPLI